jgi:hypothetical protein
MHSALHAYKLLPPNTNLDSLGVTQMIALLDGMIKVLQFITFILFGFLLQQPAAES